MKNRPGAGSVIGTDAVAKSSPDGYTLLMISAMQATNETLVLNKSYQLMRDFGAVAPLITSDPIPMSMTSKEFRDHIQAQSSHGPR